ncbi:MAG TPA: protein kinase [Gemmatimonadaceae bacterium]|nr:protein kinase [Gemmatimonadaceae bacterium]
MTVPAERLSSAVGDRYRIERELGQGGMAIVYLAEDIRHHRKVAIKVLLPELSAVLGPERFLKEIELTANLQHPNILPLFDSGVADGLLYYVMPYVEGETLRERLDREQQLAVSDTVRLASDVAGALEYAHKRGVIHRDIKPENILLQDGRPLVADFGIALAVSKAGGNRVTQTGMSLGTPQYMSPEQATGDRQIDARSDIYSLGAVTYEMLTGDPPHTGSSTQAVIAKVITEKPTPIHTIRSTVPHQVEYTVDRALAKLPADRWTSAREFAEAIEGRIAVAQPNQVQQRKTVWIPWAIAGLAVAALAFGMLRKSDTPVPQPVRFTIESVGDDKSQIQVAAISNDGQTIAIATRNGDSTALWIKRLDELNPHRLAGSDGALFPFFSPDGKSIGFLSVDGKVRRLPIEGGTPLVVGSMTNPVGVTWITPDTILAGMIAFSNQPGLTRLSMDNSEIAPLTKPGDNEMHHFPISAPDGKSILFSLFHSGKFDIGVGSMNGSYDTVAVPNQSIDIPLGLADGNLVFVGRGRLWAVPFDLKNRKLTGRPFDLGEQIGDNIVQLSPNGTLLYTSSDFGKAILLARPGQSPDTLLVDRVAGLVMPRWSPDGQAVAFAGIGDDPGLYVLDRSTRTLTRLTTSRPGISPAWSEDGKRLVSRDRTTRDVSWQSRDGSTAPELLVAAPSGGTIRECTIAPDGQTIAMEVSLNDKLAIYLSKVGGKAADAHLFAENATHPKWSPDGKWIAYEASSDDKNRIVAHAYPTGGSMQVSEDAGSHPVWPRGSKTMYYESERNIIAADVEQTQGGLRVTSRRVVWRGKSSSERADDQFVNYDVSPQGDLLVLESTSTGRTKVVVELNWASQLRKKNSQ